jgi:hypothetical protein
VIEDYHSLAVRDLQRGQGVGLPSGRPWHDIGAQALTAEQVGLGAAGYRGETPSGTTSSVRRM